MKLLMSLSRYSSDQGDWPSEKWKKKLLHLLVNCVRLLLFSNNRSESQTSMVVGNSLSSWE